MGVYLNPGNKGFQVILKSEYVDKTGLIALINKTIGTMEMLTCISRPRRFGKSYAQRCCVRTMIAPVIHMRSLTIRRLRRCRVIVNI